MSAQPVIRTVTDGPDQQTPKYWYGDDPFLTHFFNAVSSTFPEGERFFIRAVRHFAQDDNDPVIRAFVGQEGQHSKAHDVHIDLILAQGFSGIAQFNRVQKRAMGWMNRRVPRLSLALTVAIEHVTAVFAHEFLHHPDYWLEPMHPDMQRLWRWHALEEAEHKAVAFDVYTACALPLWLRRVAMLDATMGFLGEIFVRHSYLLIKDGHFRPATLWRGLRSLVGRDGILRRLAPHIGPFYRGDFHPNQVDDRSLLSQRCREWGLAAP